MARVDNSTKGHEKSEEDVERKGDSLGERQIEGGVRFRDTSGTGYGTNR